MKHKAMAHEAAAVAFAAALACWTLGPAPAAAGNVGLHGGAGGDFRVPVVSLKEARFRTIIKQQYDFSCGSAALASLLTFHYDRPTSEQDVFTVMYQRGDQEQIQQVGFSLLDMKNFLRTLGLDSDGFRVDLDKLIKVGVPAITLINTGGYRHFVVVKGYRDEEVVVGDPALGVRIMDREDFESIWNGIAFIVRDEVDTGRERFNQDMDWAVRAEAPFGTALTRQGLASFTSNLVSGAGSF